MCFVEAAGEVAADRSTFMAGGWGGTAGTSVFMEGANRVPADESVFMQSSSSSSSGKTLRVYHHNAAHGAES